MLLPLDEAIDGLLRATPHTPQWQLKRWLRTLFSISAKHGIQTRQFPRLIKYLCETHVVSLHNKIRIIDECMLPNGSFTNNDVTLELIRHLGTHQPMDKQTPKEVQIHLLKWLVHVVFLLPDNSDTRLLSCWIHLWQYNYIQRYVTYMIVWSTRSKQDIKPWSIETFLRTAKNPAYSNAAVHTTLVLKRYLSVLGESQDIKRCISNLNCPAQELKSVQSMQFEQRFTDKIKRVLVTEQPFKFSDEIIKANLKTLLFQLRDSELDPLKLNFNAEPPQDDSTLYTMHTQMDLVKNWPRLDLPTNVEPLLTNLDSIARYYPLVYENLDNGNRQIQEFWQSSYYWIQINMRRCFMERQINQQDRDRLFDKVIQNCRLYDHFLMKLANDFLTLDNFLANKDYFIRICLAVFPVLRLMPGDLSFLRNRILKILAVCHLTKNGKSAAAGNDTAFADVSCSLIFLTRNWLAKYANDARVMEFSLDLLADLRRLLLGSLSSSVENRSISIGIMMVLETLSDYIPIYEGSGLQNDDTLGKIILRSNTIDKVVTFDDPLLLNFCCRYLTSIKGILLNRPSTDVFVQVQNHYILDLTNYLWRNKIASSKKIFNISTEFIKNVLDNAFFPDIHNKPKAVFSFMGIAALSYVSVVALRRLEKLNNVRVQYNTLLNEECFKKFYKSLSHEDDWLPGINTFEELRLKLILEIYKSNAYKNIALFLFTYMKSLSTYGSKKT
ncbi:Ctf3p KNAG_0B05990 [Huiozyma naganishii CBS 8797]|uniref:Uncharacterized protein n=1 Tax=Huiozyma naganishii (strain ATCC MYA-139 / BCRC 22969 / CBS 8797 / KCTC 17520 / NBRC 10181 / NCYC 3082 / Yp74L-3) TaxID=1071383 RepID=J7S425_HUIN7|nr:hypothetical protein KNAG_0B05990 [Kazachstania naganishii CBS 8797]CCK69029.1 hypothetical protein KNAG_0B05990 [Kazachstania naganishii CBS 8797]